MAVDRAAEHRALAAQVWRQVFNLFVGTKGQRDHVLQRLRLSPNDAKTLCTMDATQAQPMRALADLCCTDASNATWVVDRLESHGLVERRAVPGDRRVKLVGLTPRGLKARNAIMEAMHEPPLEVLALDRDDLVALAKILAKIPLTGVVTTPAQPPPLSLAANQPVSRTARRRRAKQRT
ncbi:MAG: MarR family winged helix-turn-helix transcriptional regulator [Gemmatimonadaceae bacterium]